jgi:cell division septal protein FtsQ
MLKIFAKLVLLILAVAGGRLLYDKGLDVPPFTMSTVVVTGNWKTTEASVLAITGLEKGKSIYKQDLKFAANNIMKQPGVVSCTVERKSLSTVAINVEVAEPALLVNSGELNAISREGMILPLTAEMPILPLVSGHKFTAVKCYEHVSDPDIAYALEIYDALLAASPNLCSRLSEISFKDDDALRLFFSPAGTEVLITKQDIKNSIKRLAALDGSGMAQDTAIFDLRFGPVMIESSLGEATL